MQVPCWYIKKPDIFLSLSDQATADIMNITGYKFKCLPFNEMMEDIVQGGIQCDIAVGAITLNTEHMRKGIVFTFPTYRSSLGVLVSATNHHGRTWSFLTPMDWTVWAAVGATALVVPFIVFIIESWSVHGFVDTDDITSGLVQAFYDSVAMILNFGSFAVKSVEGRLVVIGYGFLVLILVNTYVANLTAFLTLAHIKSSIRDLSDLPGKQIASGGKYSRSLRGRGILVSKPFADEDKDLMMDRLVSGDFHALLYDDPWIRYQANRNCSVIPFVEKVLEFDYAFALPRRLKEAKKDISSALLLLQETGVMESLDHKFVNKRQHKQKCPLLREVTVTDPVYFDHLVGLWIILGVCVAFSFAVALLRWGNAVSRANKPVDVRKVRKLARRRTVVTSEYHPHAALAHSQSLAKARTSLNSMNDSENCCPDHTCPSQTSEGGLSPTQEETQRGIQEIRSIMEIILEKVPHVGDTIQSGVDTLNQG